MVGRTLNQKLKNSFLEGGYEDPMVSYCWHFSFLIITDLVTNKLLKRYNFWAEKKKKTYLTILFSSYKLWIGTTGFRNLLAKRENFG